jgi:hypothetical protein
VTQAVDAHAVGNLNEQGAIFDIHNLLRGHLGAVESDAVDILVGLAVVDEARADEEINERSQAIKLDAVDGQLAADIQK